VKKSVDVLKERRVRSRRGVSISERVVCKLKKGHVEIVGHVISLSPGGAAIACTNSTETSLNIGDEFVGEFDISGLETVSLIVTVENCTSLNTEKKNYQRIGLSFRSSSTTVENKRKQNGKFEVPEFMRPIVSFENPIFEYCMIHGRIVDISADSIRCETSSRNNSILPGMTFRFNTTFPIVGNIQFEGKVLYYLPNISDETKITFCIQIQSKQSDFQKLASELLIMVNPNVNTTVLTENGFAIGSILGGISLGYAFDDEDIHQIASLRLKAWREKGPNSAIQNPQEMMDEFDKYSRHMVARVNGRIVASARLVFNNGNANRCEHKKYEASIPAWLWQEGFVETSRLVTDPDFRGGDVFLLMTQMIGKTVIQAGYRYMVSSCERSLEKIYISSGCKKIGSFYTADSKEPWSLMVMDVVGTSKGIGMNPIFWNLVQRNMVEFLLKRSYFTLNVGEKILIKFYSLFRPLSLAILRIKSEKRVRKKNKRDQAA